METNVETNCWPHVVPAEHGAVGPRAGPYTSPTARARVPACSTTPGSASWLGRRDKRSSPASTVGSACLITLSSLQGYQPGKVESENSSQRPSGFLNQEKEILPTYSKWHFIFNLNLFLSLNYFLRSWNIFNFSLCSCEYYIEQEQAPSEAAMIFEIKLKWNKLFDRFQVGKKISKGGFITPPLVYHYCAPKLPFTVGKTYSGSTYVP